MKTSQVSIFPRVRNADGTRSRYAAVLNANGRLRPQYGLVNSNQAANSRDAFGNGSKFNTPLVVNGKVHIGNQTDVVVFGLPPH